MRSGRGMNDLKCWEMNTWRGEVGIGAGFSRVGKVRWMRCGR